MTFSAASPVAFLATGIFNLDSSRFAKASLDTRSEGWTESWGTTSSAVDTTTTTTTKDDQVTKQIHQIDQEFIANGSLLATNYPQLPLTITQFRPAWLEQLVLRFANLPYTVINCAYVASEATGPLPYLQDFSPKIAPVLVGRHHPTNLVGTTPTSTSQPFQNAILDYLHAHRNIDLDHILTTAHERSISKCFLTLVSQELDPVLQFLRFGDYAAWEQVYRRQYLQAAAPKNHRHRQWYVFLHLQGRMQASLERAAARQRFHERTKGWTVARAVTRAREAYQALEDQLVFLEEAHHPNNPATKRKFLMGHSKPSLVDAVVWAHLADALCDVHLVIVLADFPKLVAYFQRIYQSYLWPSSSSSSSSSSSIPQRTLEDWEKWNQQENHSNAFQQLPIGNDEQLERTGFRDAIELMQQLSLRNQDLQDVLDASKARRSTEPWPVPTPEAETLLYRWRMGEDLEKTMKEQRTASSSQEDPNDNPIRKKLIREQQRNDQIWMSVVAGVSAVAILLIQGATSPGES